MSSSGFMVDANGRVKDNRRLRHDALDKYFKKLNPLKVLGKDHAASKASASLDLESYRQKQRQERRLSLVIASIVVLGSSILAVFLL